MVSLCTTISISPLIHACFLTSYVVPPMLISFPSAVRDVVRGETFVASCQGRAEPPPMIQWLKEDQQLDVGDDSSGRVNISNVSSDVTTTSHLTVTGFTSEDVGIYTCVAFNGLGSDTRSFQVNTVGESVGVYFSIEPYLYLYRLF